MRSIVLTAILAGPLAVAAATPADTARLPFEPAVARAAAAPEMRAVGNAERMALRSASLMVVDEATGAVLVARDPHTVRPIASITKLMTAMVVLDAEASLDDVIAIDDADLDRIKGTHSRLRVGTRLTRRELLRLMLMASENRAAAALSRAYPGGRAAFIEAMNRKAHALGLRATQFVDPAGLGKENVSTAAELVTLVRAASAYPLIAQFTTTARHTQRVGASTDLVYLNSNRLIQTGNKEWSIRLSKTGYTAEAGRCLVMQATTGGRRVVMVMLNSWGKLTPVGDANRVRRWMEASPKLAGLQPVALEQASD